MAVTYEEFSGVEPEDTLTVSLEYVSQDYVKVFVDGVETSEYSWSDATHIVTTADFPEGTTTRIESFTDLDDVDGVVFGDQDGSSYYDWEGMNAKVDHLRQAAKEAQSLGNRSARLREGAVLPAGSVPMADVDGSLIEGPSADEVSNAQSYSEQALLAVENVDQGFSTQTNFASATVPSVRQSLKIDGYSSAGDGGRHLKRRISTPSPAKAWHSQSADGAWWEIAEPFVTPEMFGAKNDGTTADDTAFAACVDWVRAQPAGGKIVLLAPKASSGGYRLNASHNLWHNQRLEIEFSQGSRVYCGLTGAANVMWNRTHPTDPTIRGSRFAISGPSRVLFHPSVSGVGCVFFEARYASDLSFDASNQHVWLHYLNNTAFRFSGLFNCDMTPLTVWGAGHRKPRKNTGSVTFSISSGGTTLTASSAVFDAGDVGDTMTVGGERMVISGYTSATQVTVSRPVSQAYTNEVGTFGSVRCTTTSASDVVTLEGGVAVSSDVGRVVYILDASTAYGSGSPKRAHRSTITEVISTTQIRLADAVPLAVTLGEIIFSPAMEIFGDVGYDGKTNDVCWIGLHFEECRGTQLVVQESVNAFFPFLKLHGQPLARVDSLATDYLAIFDSSAGTIGGDFEGVTCGRLGRFVIHGGVGLMRFETVHGMATRRQPLVYMLNCLSSCVVSVGDWYLAAATDTTTMAEAFVVSGSGRFRQRGRVSAYNTDFFYPEVAGGNDRPPYGFLPTSQSDLVTGPSNASRFIMSTGTAIWGGVSVATSISTPAATPDFAVPFAAKGYALPPDLSGLLEIGGIHVTARSPSGGNVAGQLELRTRNTSGVLAMRWAVDPSGFLAPAVDNAYDLGSSGGRVKKLYAMSARLSGLPTSASGLSSGDLWNDAGTVKIVP